MRISSIDITNFLGAAAVSLRLDAPVTVICGPNGAGKSSIRDAVALALTGDLGRVSLKKEAAELITTGATAATCELMDADGDAYGFTITAAGKLMESRGGREPDPTLAYVLDAQRFARLPEKERRAFLFGLMGLKISPAAIAERLAARGADKVRIERIAPLLRGGFEAACADAKEKATSAKGAWRQVTNEAYGSQKGGTWRAEKPAFDPAAMTAATKQLADLDAALAAANQALGALRADQKRHDEQLARLPSLRETAGRLERIRTKLATDEAELQRITAEVDKAKAAAGAGTRVGLVHDLAGALNWAINFAPESAQEAGDALAALTAYESQYGRIGATTGDPMAAAKLVDLQKAVATCQRAIDNDRRDLAQAEAAAASIKEIEAQTAKPVDAAALTAAAAEADKIKAARTATAVTLEATRQVKQAADAAEKRTADAAAHHADVVAWDAIATALGPDGIPADILGEALGPINARLAQSAADSEWPLVVVHADMEITAAGRSYRMLSESEKWRVDAMLAEAIATLSKARLLVLDRVDVLDGTGRVQLLGWIDALASTGEIDTALLFATLKTVPTNLPDTVRAHWITAGRVTTGEPELLREAA